MYSKAESIPLKQITIDDSFWNHYVNLVGSKLIPYQWEVLNDRIDGIALSHSLENFRVAAGESDGRFQGAVFQDTDIGKWMEAAAYYLCVHQDEEIEVLTDQVIDLIGRAQCSDGYINTYYTVCNPDGRWKNLMEGHELYTAGHLIEAAVAYYEATGKRKFLNIVSDFADLICSVFGAEDGKIHGYPGHPEIELALVRLYKATNDKNYRDMAKYFVDQRGTGENYFLQEERAEGFQHMFHEFSEYDPRYSQSHLPVRQQEKADGHAVRAVYLYAAMADLAYEYQDESLLLACKRLWDNMTNQRMYITGSIGASGTLERFTADYDLPNDRNYSESCASIGMAMFGKRMAQITKDASYMDVVERALYNTVLAGIAMDGTSFFYVNPLEVWPENCLPYTSMEHVKPVRQKWFGVACCPPNITRTLGSLGQYIYFTEEEVIYVNLYIGGGVTINLEGKQVKLTVSTDFPQTADLWIDIEKEENQSVTLALRIPDYAGDFQILDSEHKAILFEKKNGYAYIKDINVSRIHVQFTMPVMFVRANPKVRADAGKLAIVRGPLVYCLEEVDNGDNLSSVYINPDMETKVSYETDLLGGCTAIYGVGSRISQSGWEDGALYKEQKADFETIHWKAVPYYAWGNREPGEMMVWMKEIYHR